MKPVLTRRQLARSKLVSGLFLFVMCVTFTVNYAAAELKPYSIKSGPQTKPYLW